MNIYQIIIFYNDESDAYSDELYFDFRIISTDDEEDDVYTLEYSLSFDEIIKLCHSGYNSLQWLLIFIREKHVTI